MQSAKIFFFEVFFIILPLKKKTVFIYLFRLSYKMHLVVINHRKIGRIIINIKMQLTITNIKQECKKNVHKILRFNHEEFIKFYHQQEKLTWCFAINGVE